MRKEKLLIGKIILSLILLCGLVSAISTSNFGHGIFAGNITLSSAAGRLCDSLGLCYSLADLNASSSGGGIDGSNVAFTNQSNNFTNNKWNIFDGNVSVRDNFTVDAGTLYVDGANNKVIVGLNSPTNLNVSGNITLGGGNIFNKSGSRFPLAGYGITYKTCAAFLCALGCPTGQVALSTGCRSNAASRAINQSNLENTTWAICKLDGASGGTINISIVCIDA